jgi:hypothetical protein
MSYFVTQNPANENKPALLSQGRSNFSQRNEPNSLPSQDLEFLSDYMGAPRRNRTLIRGLKGHCFTIKLWGHATAKQRIFII